MPLPYLQKLSKKYNIPLNDLEKYWDDAKKIAADAEKEDDYDYITGIFKRIINNKFDIKEDIKRFIYKENNKCVYKNDLNEGLLKAVMTGVGLLMIYNWLTNDTKEIEDLKMFYGSKVTNGEESGILIKKNNIPYILIKNKEREIEYRKWTDEWVKV